MRKNIVQVVTTMNRGGLETLLLNVYAELNDDYKFFFIVQKRGNHHYFEAIRLLGGEIRGVYRERFADYLMYPFRMYFSLKSINSDIIHSHIDTLSGVPLMIAKILGYKYRIAHGHSSTEEKNLKYPFKLLLKKLIVKYSNSLVACSYDSGRMLFGNKSDFTFIANGIEASRFSYSLESRQNIRTQFDLCDKHVLGHVGRFNLMKNQDFLIYLLAEISKVRDNVVLFLIGDGPLIEFVKAKVITMNLENSVIFHPSTDQVHLFYSAFDLFVFPSLFEGMPLALLEAQASNLKCLVSENISNESICNSLTTKLPIDRGSSDWIAAMNFESHDRSIISSELASFLQDIDINRTSEEFRKLYSVVDND
jgi:glycosyltransferase involved in cell wall biosynthesis